MPAGSQEGAWGGVVYTLIEGGREGGGWKDCQTSPIGLYWPLQEALSGVKGGAGPEEWSHYTLRYMVVHACLGSSLGLLEDSLRDFDFWSGVFQSGAKRCEWHAYCWLYVQFSLNDIDTGYPSLCATSLPSPSRSGPLRARRPCPVCAALLGAGP